MISSNLNKFLFIIFLCLSLCPSCRFWQSNSTDNDTQNSAAEIHTNIPFSTKEPDVFQAEFVVTTFISGEKTERKYFVAKKGEKILATIGVGSKQEISLLEITGDKSFRLEHSTKTYRKREISAMPADTSANQWQEFLTTKWLNEKTNAKFEKQGTQNNLTKYLVKLEDPDRSEIFIYIDEKLQIPVKQEFYRLAKGKKILSYQVEVKNFKTEVNDKLFELPKDYQEIN